MTKNVTCSIERVTAKSIWTNIGTQGKFERKKGWRGSVPGKSGVPEVQLKVGMPDEKRNGRIGRIGTQLQRCGGFHHQLVLMYDFGRGGNQGTIKMEMKSVVEAA